MDQKHKIISYCHIDTRIILNQCLEKAHPKITPIKCLNDYKQNMRICIDVTSAKQYSNR